MSLPKVPVDPVVLGDLMRDANRYRLLRAADCESADVLDASDHWHWPLIEEELDEALDDELKRRLEDEGSP